MPDIYQYLDYRQFLRDYCDEQKHDNPHFSHRYFAQKAGSKSPSHLNMVMSGERGLTLQTIPKFAKALGFDERQTEYFRALVAADGMKSGSPEREDALKKLQRLRPRVKISGLERDRYDLFKKRSYFVIREMAYLKDFRPDPSWIASHLVPSIPPSEAAQALATLKRLGLLKETPDDKLVPDDTAFVTPPEVGSIELYYTYGEALSAAKESLFKVPSDKRDFTSLIAPLPRGQLPQVKKLIENFRRDLLDLINKCEPDYEEVYQLNIQFFPATRCRSGDS